VVEVVVDTHWVKAAPLALKESMLGVETWSPKTASALRESIARKKTFGLVKPILRGSGLQEGEVYPGLCFQPLIDCHHNRWGAGGSGLSWQFMDQAQREGHAPEPETRGGRFTLRLKRNLLFLVLLVVGLILRVLVFSAYSPGLIFVGDSLSYLEEARINLFLAGWHPVLYSLFLKPVLVFDNLAVVTALQHLMGLGIAVLLYLILRRLETPEWLAALGCAPVLLDGYQLSLEQHIMPEALFLSLLLGALGLLVYNSPPSVMSTGLAGVLIAGAALTRYVGLAVIPCVLLFLLIRRVRWTRFVAFAIAVALPLLGYGLWFQSTKGDLTLTDRNGYVLYGKVATFAECEGVELPEYEQQLCVDVPREERDHTYARFNPESPLQTFDVPDGVDKNAVLESFNSRFIRRQPTDYAAAVAADFGRFFEPRSWANAQRIVRWRFIERFEDVKGIPGPIQRNEGSTPGRLGLDPEFRVDESLATTLRSYQSFVFVWGPLLALASLLGLAGAIWGPASSGRIRSAAFLFLSSGLALYLFCAVFGAFRVRYYIPGLITIMPAGALGASLLLERLRSRGTEPDIAPEEPAAVDGPVPVSVDVERDRS
jgi:hypothetical protein